jgi:hypothetical protein
VSGLVLRWRVPAPFISTRWRGPDGALAAVAQMTNPALAGFVVPSVSAGTTAGDGIEVIGTEVRIDIQSLPSAP